MSRNYKNVLKKGRIYGTERRANLAKEILKDSSPLPNPIEYKDIDEEFRRWVDEDLGITYNGEKLPTVALFSNQRFSEYLQSWANVDDRKNLILNFKTITRENNPKSGTINGQTKNIPGERSYLMKRVEAMDRNGRKYYIDYRVKQPFGIDLIYTVNIVTNKYELLNEFNLMVNEKFKAIDCYIRPKGHFMAMKLNDISDESEYSIDNRQFYSQSYNILVMGYIMREDDFIVEEKPVLKFRGFEGEQENTYAEIEELPCGYEEECPYGNMPVVINIHFDTCSTSYKFNIDCDFKSSAVTYTNVRNFKIFINDTEVDLEKGLEARKGNEIKIKSLTRYKTFEPSVITIQGFDVSNTYKKSEGIETKVEDFF